MTELSPQLKEQAVTVRGRRRGAGGELQGLVFDIDKFAIHDGPGIRTTVYLKGCPLKCWWCHSPESQLGRPQLLYLQNKCTGCNLCLDVCPTLAIRPASENSPATAADERATVGVDWPRCIECGECAAVCYPGALKMAGEWMPASRVLDEIAKDAVFFQLSGGGVTLTGGEVTQQSAFAYEVLSGCRTRGIHTAVETTGMAPWRVLSRLAEVTDLFLYDLKQMDDARHRELTGVSNELILANLRRLAAGARPEQVQSAKCKVQSEEACGVRLGAGLDGTGRDRRSAANRQNGFVPTGAGQGAGYEIVVRVPCIPGLTDGEEDVRAIAAFASELGLRTVHLLPYNASAAAKYGWIGRPYLLLGLTTQPHEQMERLARICRERGLTVQIGG
ncbi:MAG: glycyl-radical enzyme activating protein [Chloroflexi bacterium]|nr:glycyl-radical enzyme activating protein [Chloroflexota bacterium]